MLTLSSAAITSPRAHLQAAREMKHCCTLIGAPAVSFAARFKCLTKACLTKYKYLTYFDSQISFQGGHPGARYIQPLAVRRRGDDRGRVGNSSRVNIGLRELP